jgi:hypothetical protein
MAKSVFVRLTDDLDGSEADETVIFSIDSKSYEIDLNKKNAAELRKVLKPYIDAGRSSKQPPSRGRSSGPASEPTLFSQLDSEEKDRFRKWAKLPDARRIRDSRVKEWIDAGRP